MIGVSESFSHKGLGRSYQEDRCIISTFPKGTLLAVADGHGGEGCSDYVGGSGDGLVLAWDLVWAENKPAEQTIREVFEILATATQSMEDGSTLSLVYIPFNEPVAYVGILGDSPVFIKKAGGEIYAGPEHNVGTNPEEAKAAYARGGVVLNGYLYSQKALSSDRDNAQGIQMARSLGDKELGEVLSRIPDIDKVELDSSSWILLATDGVFDQDHARSGILTQSQIKAIDNGTTVRKLVEVAVHFPTYDNATAVLWRQ